MSGRQGGKLKPLKAPKAKKEEVSEEDIELKKKLRDEDKKLKEAQAKLLKKKWIRFRNIILIEMWEQKIHLKLNIKYNALNKSIY